MDAGRAPLVGRADELGALRTRLSDVVAGRGAVVFIEGEAGIGKTSLLEALLDVASGRALQVFRGACQELERDRPFGPLIDGLGLREGSPDPRRQGIADLLVGQMPPGGGPAQAPELRFRIAEGIVELVEEVSATEPVLLAVEDLHWADASTLLALRRLAPLVRQLPLLLVLTARTFPRTRDLDRMVEQLEGEGALLVELRPLDRASMDLLVRGFLGAEPGPNLQSQVQASGGNPLFATELLSTLASEGAIEQSEGKAEVTERMLPPSLRLTILRRLSFLDERSLELLRLAAVLGSTFTLGDLGVATDETAVRLTTRLRSSLAAGVVKESGERFAFRHELVRDALYEDLPLATRKGLHLEIARRLASAGSSPSQVAAHFAVAAPKGDREALHWLRAAAGHALERDPLTARDLLERALELAGDVDGRDEILLELLVALTWSGHEEDAIGVGYDLLERVHDPATEISTRMSLANALFLQSRMAESVEQCELAAGSPTVPDQTRAALLGRLAASRIWAGEVDGGAEAAAQAKELGRRTGSDLGLCLGLINGAWAAFLQGYTPEAIAECGRGADLAARTRDAEVKRAIMAHNSLSFMLIEADRLGDAEKALATGRRVADEVGRVWDLPIYHYYLGYTRYLEGRWDDATTELEAGFSIAGMIETLLGSVFAHCLRSVIAIHQDDLGTAERALEAADRQAEKRAESDFESHYRAWPRARLLEARDDPERALRVVHAGWEQAALNGYVCFRRVLGPDLVRLAVSMAERDLATAATEDLTDAASRADVPSVRGAAIRCRGLLDGDSDLLRDSVTEYRKGPRVMETAAAQEDAGRLLLETERADEGRRLLAEAAEAYERVGAAREANRLNAYLRRHGVRRARRGKHRRARTGWESLTPSEEKVLGLVAEGLSNPQIAAQLFISRHTVETHVSHILEKIGAGSRVELAARWAQRTREPTKSLGE